MVIFEDETELQEMCMNGFESEGMNVTVYEVGPRDGLQYLEHIVSVDDKRQLIQALYDAGIENIEE